MCGSGQVSNGVNSWTGGCQAGLPEFSSFVFLSFSQIFSLPFNMPGAYNSTCLYFYKNQPSHKTLKCATDPLLRVKLLCLNLEHV